MKKIICVGDLCCDLIVPYGRMKEALRTGDISKKTTEGLQTEMRGGGSVGNMVRVLGCLGQKPVFVTPLKEDELGRYLKEELLADGVNMDYAAPSEKSCMTCIAVLDEKGERTMFCFVPPWADFPVFAKDSFAPALSEEPALVFTSGMALINRKDNNEAVLSFFRKMKEAGSTIVFDLNVRAESYGFRGTRRTSFLRMIRLTDIILGSGSSEFAQVTGCTDIGEAAQKLLAMQGGSGTVIARDGGNPVRIVTAHGTESVRVRKVKPLSTVGAGDAFDAAFLAKVRAGADMKTSVKAASHLAGFFIRHKGVRNLDLAKIL
jgi:sugar/nucleoside kinase (ribokinase family)